jgi:hypothetical protein
LERVGAFVERVWSPDAGVSIGSEPVEADEVIRDENEDTDEPLLTICAILPDSFFSTGSVSSIPSSIPGSGSNTTPQPKANEEDSSNEGHLALAHTLGVLLVLLARYFSDNGSPLVPPPSSSSSRSPNPSSTPATVDREHRKRIITKSTIRRRLEWIVAEAAWVNPPRWVLRRVNEYLMPGAEQERGE